MVGGNRTSDLDKEAGFHIPFSPQHVAASERFIDDVAALGHIPHIEWATEWFGNGGYANPTPSTVASAVVGGLSGGNTEQVGWLLYTSYLIPFEIASMLLLVAMIGAIVLAKREL